MGNSSFFKFTRLLVWLQVIGHDAEIEIDASFYENKHKYFPISGNTTSDPIINS